MSEEISNIKLTIIGFDGKDGTYTDCVKKIKELGLNEIIKIEGPIEKDDIPLLADEHALYINCSIVDNTPVSTIEAMAMGMCIIGTNVGGIPFLLDKDVDSIIIEPKDSNLLAKAIIRIITDKKLSDKLSNHAYRSSKRFDWHNVINEWENLFNEIKFK